MAEDERISLEFELMVDRNKQLEKLCSMKEQELQTAKQEAITAKKVAKRAKIYNIVMLIITISAWLFPKPTEIIKMIGGWFD